MLAYGDRRTSSYDDLLETLTSHIKREPEALSVKTLNQNVRHMALARSTKDPPTRISRPFLARL
jgi:hypothetical protein